MTTHKAAVCIASGEPFQVQLRPTPKPGPGELLIAVKSVALNPADYHIRDQGLFIPSYPTVIGFDISGLVLEVGDNVPAGEDDAAPIFRPGITRVAAYAASFWRAYDPNYGAFQERCLIPWQHAAPLPDESSISWNLAATLPVAVEVALNAWEIMGVPRASETPNSSTIPSEDSSGEPRNPAKKKEEALLVWGAASSVGTMGVQTARLLRDDHGSSFAAVYATASVANHDYIASLGADRVFDYKDPQLVEAIVSAARQDGLVIRHCFLANGQLQTCQAVLKAFVPQNQGFPKKKAKIASAPLIPKEAEEVDGIDTIFVIPSSDESERLVQFRYWMVTWLSQKLASGQIRPSPELKVVGRGLEAINPGLDTLFKGVSCVKLVVEVSESE